jgi:hypothetical protein
VVALLGQCVPLHFFYAEAYCWGYVSLGDGCVHATCTPCTASHTDWVQRGPQQLLPHPRPMLPAVLCCAVLRGMCVAVSAMVHSSWTLHVVVSFSQLSPHQRRQQYLAAAPNGWRLGKCLGPAEEEGKP